MPLQKNLVQFHSCYVISLPIFFANGPWKFCLLVLWVKKIPKSMVKIWVLAPIIVFLRERDTWCHPSESSAWVICVESEKIVKIQKDDFLLWIFWQVKIVLFLGWRKRTIEEENDQEIWVQLANSCARTTPQWISIWPLDRGEGQHRDGVWVPLQSGRVWIFHLLEEWRPRK